MSTLAELAVANANTQPDIIDNLTEDSPILADMQMQPSSNGMLHLAEKITRIVGGNLIDPDGVRPSMLCETALEQQQLSVLGGIMKKGRDTVDLLGGPGKYFGSKMPSVLRYTGNDVERSIYHNSLVPFAFANDKLISAGGSSTELEYLLVVTWQPGELCGLAHPDFVGGGANFLEVNPLNGGNYYEDPASPGSMVYGQDARSFLGLNLGNARYISGIVNIDLTLVDGVYTAAPTVGMLCDVIDAARPVSGRSFIYCTPKMHTAISNIWKGQNLVMVNADRSASIKLADIEGVAIRPSRNIVTASEALVIA